MKIFAQLFRRHVCETRGARILNKLLTGHWQVELRDDRIRASRTTSFNGSVHFGTYVSSADWECYALSPGGRVRKTAGRTITTVLPDGSVFALNENLREDYSAYAAGRRRIEDALRRIHACGTGGFPGHKQSVTVIGRKHDPAKLTCNSRRELSAEFARFAHHWTGATVERGRHDRHS